MSCLPSKVEANLHVSKKEFLPVVVFGFGFRFFGVATLANSNNLGFCDDFFF